MTIVDTLKVRLELVNNTSKTLLAISNGLSKMETQMRKVEVASQGVIEKQEKMTRAVDSTVISARELYYALVSWGAAYASINIARQVMETSDAISMATARLGLLTDDVKGLSDLIYQMSQETRTNFLDMMGVVSKMGINVGVGDGGWFENLDELVKFNELVSKTFAIGGQNTKEINSAMLQLTQALSSGRLQGDEFRSLFENSPLYVRYIGEYLGELYGAVDEAGNSIALTNGQLKELGAQGLLTSDVLIDAMFYAADEIEEKFDTVPRTFQQRFEQIRNIVVKQAQNLLETLNNIVDNASFDKFLYHLTNQVTVIIAMLDAVLTAISPIIQFVLSNWNIMGPLILATAGAMAYFAITTELSANSSLRQAIALRKTALAMRLVDISQKITHASSVALFNIYRLLSAVVGNQWAIAQLNIIKIGRRYTTTLKLTNFLLKHEVLATTAATIAGKIYNIAQYENIVGRMARWVFQKLNIAGYMQEATAAGFATLAVSALNAALFYVIIPLAIGLALLWAVLKVINYVTGSSYGLAEVLMGTLGVAVAAITNFFIGLYNAIVSVINVLGTFFTGSTVNLQRKEYVDYGEYWDKWREKGRNMSIMNYSLGNQDYSSMLSDDLMAGIDALIGNTGEIADNTSMTSDDVKFLRAMAENRVLTRMNTMNINIVNNNEMTVNSDRDLDGIAEYLTASLTEAMSNGARGVHF